MEETLLEDDDDGDDILEDTSMPKKIDVGDDDVEINVEGKENESKEIEGKEIEGKEIEGKEIEGKEMEGKEMEVVDVGGKVQEEKKEEFSNFITSQVREEEIHVDKDELDY